MGTTATASVTRRKRAVAPEIAASKPAGSAAFASGAQIYLRGLEQRDLPSMIAWINDHEVTRLLYTGGRPASLTLLEEEWAKTQRDADAVVFAVCEHGGQLFLGTTGLYGINWTMRSAEFRIFLGEKQCWNRGIGTECTKLMVTYAFETLNLNRVWLGVNAEHAGAVRAYEKAGFVREGVLRQEQYRNFRYYDVVRMGLLRSDYEQMRAGSLAA